MDNSAVPKDFLTGLKENWKNDIISGFTVFLIALPLCIGISLASGAPPLAGIFSAIVGGVVISLLSGSHLTINGPAAGLIVIILNSIDALGGGEIGFKRTLAAIFFAGLIQIAFGFFKMGFLSLLFPAAVIHGMLAAIGVIIITKQIHIALGTVPAAKSLTGMMLEIPESFMRLNPEVVVISLISILILVLWPKIKFEKLKKIPAALAVVICAVSLELIFDFSKTHTYMFLGKTYSVQPNLLVSIPKEGLLGSFTFPDFSMLLTLTFLIQVIAITLVGSVESLLTAAAVDKLDPHKRHSDMDRELLAKGAGNSILGLIGGLPIIAEVVRSSANINAGAKTRWSNFFHGAFLFAFVLFLPDLIRIIPLAALASMLIVTGYRLSVPEFVKSLNVGKEQILYFMITVIFSVAEDLLVGIALGMVSKVITTYIFASKGGADLKSVFSKASSVSNTGQDSAELHLEQVCTFLNYLGLRNNLKSLAPGKNVKVIFSDVKFIDHTTMENLTEFQHEYNSSGGKMEFLGMERLKPFSEHSTAARVFA
ncbi:MAG TPA: SulP family inorganic anion transporter [Leptospiraceae bacterium]|nr:SulP family inorganic anion transporter [Leptospiraceae bacterium]HMZ57380.1 SulP family inorganic anion transporter [Leptospiraceae bacterium]HNF14504.1 SulP family inorganic anion transporter [Leptospiraceae bacterium]HNF23963.1 SulP family inorganic anion transporter [Leptospiraceae bacterium]HNI94670.1 SulP family inorganic anion transporter [Leptospiraceae bacterium]